MPDRAPSEFPYQGIAPLFVFDGHCVLCSTGARWLMRFDRAGRVAFASAQSPLGEALYRHFGMSLDESYLLVIDRRAWTKSTGYLRLCAILGGVWNVFRVTAIIPRRWRDRAYDMIARNRYRLFGRVEQCVLLNDSQRARLIG